MRYAFSPNQVFLSIYIWTLMNLINIEITVQKFVTFLIRVSEKFQKFLLYPEILFRENSGVWPKISDLKMLEFPEKISRIINNSLPKMKVKGKFEYDWSIQNFLTFNVLIFFKKISETTLFTNSYNANTIFLFWSNWSEFYKKDLCFIIFCAQFYKLLHE